MKAKILCVLLAVCLFASMLPLTVSAADPAVTVGFSNKAEAKRFSVTINPGETKYVTTNDAKEFVEWTEAGAPADKFVKLEYPADGNATVKATLNNVNADCTSTAYKSPCIEFKNGQYAVVIDVVGENTLTHGNSACIFYEAEKGMTITGSGTLNLNNSMSVDGSIWARGGDLLLKNTKINFNVSIENTSIHSAILSAKGNVNIEGCKITSQTSGGALVFMGTMTEKVGRHTMDEATDRFVKVKDSEITHTTKVRGFSTKTPVTFNNSTVKMTITGSTSSSALFTVAPTFEGDYTAIAGLAKNADKLDKLKYFDAKKISSYTYFYMVPGIVELLPTIEPTETTPAPTTPDATEPEATTPVVNTPDATTPEATTPDATTPNANTPNATTPGAETPEGETPDATTPATNAPDADENAGEEEGGNALKVILIVGIVLVVCAGGAFGVIFYLKKKKA